MGASKQEWSIVMEFNFVSRPCDRCSFALTVSSAAWYIAETRTKQNSNNNNMNKSRLLWASEYACIMHALFAWIFHWRKRNGRLLSRRGEFISSRNGADGHYLALSLITKDVAVDWAHVHLYCIALRGFRRDWNLMFFGIARILDISSYIY